MRVFHIISILFFIGFISCKNDKAATETVQEPEVASKTPVKIGYATDTVSLDQSITLNATAAYLLKSDVKANTTGYITQVNIKLADQVGRGQTLFVLQTKEARALGNTINKLDKSFRFSGTSSVQSPSSGYVNMLNHQIGDYVQDGEVLASVTDQSSFGFVMNVPYEYNQLVNLGNRLDVLLPDNRILSGYVAKIMPNVDPVSQTEKVLVKVNNGGKIPENLIAKIALTKDRKSGIAVPKSSVLTDDVQSEFWVMKLINDTTAVKTIIEKGLENDKWVELKSNNISLKDRLLTSGNFGLSDTASVKIEK